MQMGPSEVMVTALSAGQSFSDSKSLKSDEQKKSEKFRDLLPPAPLLVKVGRAYSHSGLILEWPLIIHANWKSGIEYTNVENDGEYKGRSKLFLSPYNMEINK